MQTSTNHQICILIPICRIDIREDANNNKVIWCKNFQEVFAQLSIELPRLASAPDVSFSSVHFYLFVLVVQRVWSGFSCRFRTLILVLPETATVSFRTQSFCFPLIALSLSSFSTTLTPATLDHCSCYDFLMSGVKISKSKFLIYASLHHRFQFW